ncbi:MAG: DMT family transporter [Hoeflea sp.]|uniref:DMT family transporter n=1 Tax=Hoeflea sp. TaxID=1940281 RepID=UPI001D2E7DA8|nr:DMT family transporter [Hoeflea sp.]MBU4530546.1 DMT family transporter [Alphaproteobacteria bacterium]MBU4545333.1 DMT family transporter [Alphaproteobacteria bacterium]MBU4548982.1 DMT family transporter [Alphaproteobacteria bacterium]MBV1722137.1 DMT family transporter [Hoeflea sp.]MBV1761487.1 DMT family transporter [Hoeflea sp.]
MALTPNMRGALFMSLSMAGFTINDSIFKLLTDDLSIAQLMFLRGVVASTLIYLLARHRRALRPLRFLRDRWVVLRVVGELGGTLTFLAGLAQIPIANASAILQALPLAVTMGAAMFLSEPVGWRRWAAILTGFAGILIIVRPGFEGFSPYALMIVGTVIFATVRDIATRKVDVAVPSLFLSTVTAIAVTLAGFVLIWPMGGWKPVSGSQFALISLAACLLLIGYQFIIMSMREGEISFVAPFRYTSLLWALLMGVLLFGEYPDIYMIVGSAIVIASGLYTLYRERIKSSDKPASRAAPRHSP